MPTPKVKYPQGWNDAKARRVATFYDDQSPADAVAEDEAAFAKPTTVVEVPTALLSEVMALIASHRKSAHTGKPRRRKSA